MSFSIDTQQAMTPNERQRWLDWILITSIPLRRIGANDIPIGTASGCLVNYRDRRFILTASHVVKLGSSDWVIELGRDEKKGTEIFRPACFLYLGEMRRGTGEITDADFCYAEVPTDLDPTFRHLTPIGPKSEKRLRHIFDLSAVGKPDANEVYGFSGNIHPELHGTHALVTEATVYPGLRFDKSDGPFYDFKLPVTHPGDDFFEGCSGAPIVDIRGRLVALVSGGDKAESIIHGIALSRYKFAIDFYCNDIRPA